MLETSFVDSEENVDKLIIDAHCCHMDTAIKQPVPDLVKPSFVFFDIQTRYPDLKNYK